MKKGRDEDENQDGFALIAFSWRFMSFWTEVHLFPLIACTGMADQLRGTSI